ncbi:MAG: outer membrane protein assembly factor BamD [Bryobacteraceae bacterium]
MHSSKFRRAPAILAAMGMAFLTSCVHHYETPITKNTQQPDKVLYDQAMKDINHGRYEIARISLQTLMNTYQSSEYLAKAKLAIADSWFREGGINGMAEAEAEYKDFILFYPNMPEAAEAQYRVCNIHYKQMDGSDRDWTQTLRANDECKAVLTQFPNSKYAPMALQKLRNIQESLADHEFVVGHFYFRHDMNPAAANRLNALVNQYPLFSKADEALYEAGISYGQMGPRFRKRAGQMFSRIVQDYPLSARADDAKKKLKDLELPIPQANQEAAAREEYNEKHYQAPSMLARMTGWLHSGPDVRHASQIGQPTMHRPVRTYPLSIPLVHTETASATGSATGTAALSATTVGASDNALEQKPDARTVAGTQTPSVQKQPLPTNHDKALKKYQKREAKLRAKQLKKIEKERAKAKKKQHNKKEREAAKQNPGQGGVYSNPSGSGATQQQ